MMSGTGGGYSLVSSKLNLMMAVAFLIDLPCYRVVRNLPEVFHPGYRHEWLQNVTSTI